MIGTSDTEPSRAEYKVGEHVLADLEFGSPEKAGILFFTFSEKSFYVSS